MTAHVTGRAPPVTPEDRLYRIVEDGMCIGCGLCQSVVGPDVVRVEKVESGYECPVVVWDLDHETVDRILDVCPGTRLDGLPDRLVDADTKHDLIWGPYKRMVRAWASDPEVRYRGSTGGVLTALGQYLVASGSVDFVLHVRASPEHPTFGERHVSADARSVQDGAGSRYGPTAPLVDIGDHLDRGRPFAFIGKPCDVAALRNLARFDARVDELVQYQLALVCGGFMPPHGGAPVPEGRVACVPCYRGTMITSFRDRGTQDVFNGKRTRAARRVCPQSVWRIAARRLDQLDSATELRDLRAPPGNRLEALSGDRAGQHGIRINDQYRVCFLWTDARAEQVEIVDYH